MATKLEQRIRHEERRKGILVPLLDPRVKDLRRKKFGRLRVLEYAGSRDGRAEWLCLCECGNYKTVLGRHLTTGNTQSCGCLKLSGNNFQHGHNQAGAPTPTYRSWQKMRARCNNPRNNRFSLYGGRGIKVCRRWDSFENFLADMGERPLGMTLDRIDPDGDYKPGNCRWATPTQQRANRRQ